MIQRAYVMYKPDCAKSGIYVAKFRAGPRGKEKHRMQKGRRDLLGSCREGTDPGN